MQGGAWPAFRGAGQPVFPRGGAGWGGATIPGFYPLPWYLLLLLLLVLVSVHRCTVAQSSEVVPPDSLALPSPAVSPHQPRCCNCCPSQLGHLTINMKDRRWFTKISKKLNLSSKQADRHGPRHRHRQAAAQECHRDSPLRVLSSQSSMQPRHQPNNIGEQNFVFLILLTL